MFAFRSSHGNQCSMSFRVTNTSSFSAVLATPVSHYRGWSMTVRCPSCRDPKEIRVNQHTQRYMPESWNHYKTLDPRAITGVIARGGIRWRGFACRSDFRGRERDPPARAGGSQHITYGSPARTDLPVSLNRRTAAPRLKSDQSREPIRPALTRTSIVHGCYALLLFL